MTNDNAERHLHAVQHEDEPETHEVRTTLHGLVKVLGGMVSDRGLQIYQRVDHYDLYDGGWVVVERVFRSLSEFEVACPKCGANAWSPCVKTTGPNTGQRAKDIHRARSKRRLTHANRWLRYTSDGPEVTA